MCGIVGSVDIHGIEEGVLASRLTAMAERIRYRGPDSSGVWCSPDVGVGFAHRRLSILDLSPLGHQPMHSSSGRYTITFNGEVFNYAELIKELGVTLKGGSDTEVMLACFERYGVRDSIRRFVGMFAFAVWDHAEKELTLVRDRLGIKPLFFGWIADSFVFTSDLHALRAHPAWCNDVSGDAAALYMRYGYVPAPWSILEGVWKLAPGALLSISRDQLHRRAAFHPQSTHIAEGTNPNALIPERYWRAEDHAMGVFEGSPDDAVAQLEALLEQSIRLRMIADVPLGAFLSGGVDSSLVVAMMQKVSSRPVRTFSIGFGDARYNEAPFARAVAGHLGTDHTDLHVTEDDALAIVPQLQEISDEPFADSSLIPTYLVSKLARESVTVSLSGDGGDELFGGYDRYLLLDKVMRVLLLPPRGVRRAFGAIGKVLPLEYADWIQRGLRRVGLFPFDLHNPGEKFRRVVGLIDSNGPAELYARSIQHWPQGSGVREGLGAGVDVARIMPPGGQAKWDNRAMMALTDLIMYMPDDILTKVDRASMACSLEARVPLLDHRLVEFALRLPSAIKYRDGRGKWPLRELLARHIPRELIDRPKKGFSVPLDDWLRGSLRDWAEDLLSQHALLQTGMLDPTPIRLLWQEHLSGKRNVSQLLWTVLMFQQWSAANK